MPKKSQNKKTVLVIGDWFVDENWIMARRELGHSSHTGDTNYAAIASTADKRLLSVGGAAALMGQLAKRFGSGGKYRFVGVGAWSRDDDSLIRCLLCNKNKSSMRLNPFSLFTMRNPRQDGNCIYGVTEGGKKKDPCVGMDLVNLATKKMKKTKNAVTTDRIVRCFIRRGNGTPELKYRYDFTIRKKPGATDPKILTDWLKEDVSTDDDDLRREICAVVISDYDRGVVTEETIRALIKLFEEKDPEKPREKLHKKPAFFVRSKKEIPEWVPELIENDFEIALMMSDFQLARRIEGERRWWYGRRPGRASLELLRALTNPGGNGDDEAPRLGGKRLAPRAAVLLGDNTVIAQSGEDCFCIDNDNRPTHAINITRSTTFYASLIAQMLPTVGTNIGTKKFYKICHAARDAAYAWSGRLTKSLEKDSYLLFDMTRIDALRGYNADKIRIDENTPIVKKEDVSKEWRQSSSGLGLVKPTDGKRKRERKQLQLWRGESSLSGYICVGPKKRKDINRLLSSLSEFVGTSEPPHQFSSLITGAPGWGKSFLARCLAEKYNMVFREYSVAQMVTANDFAECLAMIVSEQNKTQRRLLIFIDEVNAQIEGNYILGMLLGPLWGGSFVYNSKIYTIDPAAWLFASTGTIDSMQEMVKGSDFASRLTGPIIQLGGELSDLKVEVPVKNPRARIEENDGEETSKPTEPEYVLEERTILQDIRERLNTLENDPEEAYKSEVFESPGWEAWRDAKPEPEQKTEQVYIMLSLLRRKWGAIRDVDEAVLRLFHDMLPVNGVRSMEIFASKFVNINEETICPANVPVLWKNKDLWRHVVVPPRWFEGTAQKRKSRRSMVDVVSSLP